MTRTECDNCRRLDDAPAPPGWIVVAVQQEEDEQSHYGPGAEMAGTFCGWPCVQEYASAKALIPAEDPQGGAS
jgi:hypothetical protein